MRSSCYPLFDAKSRKFLTIIKFTVIPNLPFSATTYLTKIFPAWQTGKFSSLHKKQPATYMLLAGKTPYFSYLLDGFRFTITCRVFFVQASSP